jgi:hypothetical protein
VGAGIWVRKFETHGTHERETTEQDTGDMRERLNPARSAFAYLLARAIASRMRGAKAFLFQCSPHIRHRAPNLAHPHARLFGF